LELSIFLVVQLITGIPHRILYLNCLGDQSISCHLTAAGTNLSLSSLFSDSSLVSLSKTADKSGVVALGSLGCVVSTASAALASLASLENGCGFLAVVSAGFHSIAII
jgi:hypothetical protein